METVITLEFIVTAISTIVLAATLGFLGQRWMGAALLGIGAALASALCIAGVVIGYELGQSTGAWAGLVAGMALGGALGSWLVGKFIRGRSRRFIAYSWFGYCGLCVFGYLAGGWLGLLTITVPCLLVFWIGLFRISRYTLPLRDKSQRRKAFRSLLSHAMGTNYPYYFIKDGQVEERVKGNPYGQFFAGPGLVYTDCDHAAYITDGIRVKGVYDPGLSFTGMFDLEPKALDLRAQLRAFNVEALTKDGIPIRVLVFMPFRVHAGKQEVEMGKSFPFLRKAVFEIVTGEFVERRRQKEAGGDRHEWDGTLVPTLVTPIVQDVICTYTVDELCAPLDPGSDPRIDIADEIKKRARSVLLPRGIELIGGGISNLEPLDDTVVERRLDNWKTEWERKILLLMSEGKAERTRQIERARAEAEAEIVLRFGQIMEESTLHGNASQIALALRFVDCLGEIISESGTQWPLPNNMQETLRCLRGEIENGQR
jgi:regulator of protease activity HflC (stomatin/prohibitin superfamily)